MREERRAATRCSDGIAGVVGVDGIAHFEAMVGRRAARCVREKDRCHRTRGGRQASTAAGHDSLGETGHRSGGAGRSCMDADRRCCRIARSRSGRGTREADARPRRTSRPRETAGSPMKNALKIALGILTSIGGFLDVGAIATSAEAGTSFGYQLIWAVVLSTICIIFLLEMSGRLAAVSRHTVADIVRERFGFRFFVFPLVAEIIVDSMVLAAEIGGVCLALQLLTGISFHWFALPVGFLVWLLIWGGTFSLIEDGTALLGLVTICFVVAAWKMHPSMREIAAGAIPSLPRSDAPNYWFIAVSIIGAVV